MPPELVLALNINDSQPRKEPLNEVNLEIMQDNSDPEPIKEPLNDVNLTQIDITKVPVCSPDSNEVNLSPLNITPEISDLELSKTSVALNPVILPPPEMTSTMVRAVEKRQFSKFWFSNRTPFSLKADRQMKEYFYHCVRNFDFPMRLNYCWNFSIKHEKFFKKTITKPYRVSKVYAKKAATAVGDKILLIRSNTLEKSKSKRNLNDQDESTVAREEEENVTMGSDQTSTIHRIVSDKVPEKKRSSRLRKKFATAGLRTQRFFKNLVCQYIKLFCYKTGPKFLEFNFCG